MNARADTWLDLGPLDAVAPRGARIVKTATGCLAVFRTMADEVFVLEDRCPHKNGPLSSGIVHGRSVTCPLHNWVISLETGRAQGADEGATRTFPARIRDGRIEIRAAALAAAQA